MPRLIRACKPRRGIETLEVLLALPVLVIVTMAFFQFGITMVVHHAVMASAAEGAREAAKGATAAEVGTVVETVLSAHGLTVAANSGVMVIVEDDTNVDCIGDTVTFAAECPMATSITDPDEVRVTVLVSFDVAPVPNVLATYFVDFSGKRYELSSVARKTS